MYYNPPQRNPQTFNSSTAAQITLANPFPAGAAAGVSAPYSIDPHFVTPYIQQYGLGMQMQLTWPSTLKPADFPAYMAPLTGVTMRSEQSVRLLMSKPKLTYDDFVELKYTNRALLADRILPVLLDAAAASDDANVKDAVAVLTAWNHVFNPESKGALLFENWCTKFTGPNFTSESNFAAPFSLKAPLDTPSGLKDPAAAVKMLGQAAVDTRGMFGSLERPYGDVTKYKAGDVAVAGESGSGSIGIFPSMVSASSAPMAYATR